MRQRSGRRGQAGKSANNDDSGVGHTQKICDRTAKSIRACVKILKVMILKVMN